MDQCVHTTTDFHSLLSGVSVQPSVSNIPTLESGDVRGNGETGTNVGGGMGGSGGGDDTDGGIGQVMVCLDLTSGNLQRNVSVNVMTLSSPTSTGL